MQLGFEVLMDEYVWMNEMFFVFLQCAENSSGCILLLSFILLRLMHRPLTRAQRSSFPPLPTVHLRSFYFSILCASLLVFEAICCSFKDEPYNVFIRSRHCVHVGLMLSRNSVCAHGSV